MIQIPPHKQKRLCFLSVCLYLNSDVLMYNLSLLIFHACIIMNLGMMNAIEMTHIYDKGSIHNSKKN